MLGCVVEFVEVFNFVVYLVSDELSYFIGVEFVVDGGIVVGLVYNDFGVVEVFL